MGATPLSFTELHAYNCATGSGLNGEEILLLRKMSSAYCAELNDKNPTKKAPFSKEDIIT